MRRVTLTDAQVSALVRELRRLDLSSKPASQDILKRLERLADRNDAARYPTPPAEGSQVDLGENGADSRTERGSVRKASNSTAWRCDPQEPSSGPHEAAIPLQSVFALDTAGAAARATIKQFESRHPQAQPEVRTDVDAEQGEHGHGEIDLKIKEEPEEEVMAETPGFRKRKRRRTRVE